MAAGGKDLNTYPPPSDSMIVGFLDNDKKRQENLVLNKFKCYAPEQIANLEYDKVIIALKDKNARDEALTQLLALNVSRGAIYFYPSDTKLKQELRNDRTREKCFELCARLSYDYNVAGNVAECGVSAGKTAGIINKYFHDKKLYLFDTFSGFVEVDLAIERKFQNDKFIGGYFDNTGGFNHDVERVMSELKYPENVIIKKGWVPSTFRDVDDTFCFIHLDMDLYQPMFEAIKFFWNKINKNGLILLHDYHNPCFGVKQAVVDFETYLGRTVPKAPVPHAGIILVKD